MTPERASRIARLVEAGSLQLAAVALEQEARADVVHGRLFRALAQVLSPTDRDEPTETAPRITR